MLTKQNTKTETAEDGAKNHEKETIDKTTIFYRTENIKCTTENHCSFYHI